MKSKLTAISQPLQRRNPVAAAPILRKGGVHQRSRTAERAQTRRQLRRECAAWPEEPPR